MSAKLVENSDPPPPLQLVEPRGWPGQAGQSDLLGGSQLTTGQ